MERKKEPDDTIEIEFIQAKKLSLNYDINKEGIKRRFKKDFDYLVIHAKIILKSAELYYQEMNLYLYRRWLDYEKGSRRN